MVAIASSIVSTHQWTRQDVVSPQRLKARGPVAQWIRHRPTEPGIAGSSPAGVIGEVQARAGWIGGDQPHTLRKAPHRRQPRPLPWRGGYVTSPPPCACRQWLTTPAPCRAIHILAAGGQWRCETLGRRATAYFPRWPASGDCRISPGQTIWAVARH